MFMSGVGAVICTPVLHATRASPSPRHLLSSQEGWAREHSGMTRVSSIGGPQFGAAVTGCLGRTVGTDGTQSGSPGPGREGARGPLTAALALSHWPSSPHGAALGRNSFSLSRAGG